MMLSPPGVTSSPGGKSEWPLYDGHSGYRAQLSIISPYITDAVGLETVEFELTDLVGVQGTSIKPQ